MLPTGRLAAGSGNAPGSKAGTRSDGYDPVETLMDFARTHRITQIFIGHPSRVHWWDRFLGGPLDRLIRDAEGIDVRVFPH